MPVGGRHAAQQPGPVARDRVEHAHPDRVVGQVRRPVAPTGQPAPGDAARHSTLPSSVRSCASASASAPPELRPGSADAASQARLKTERCPSG